MINNSYKKIFISKTVQLTLVPRNCLLLLKLKLIMQFSTQNDNKYSYLWKIQISLIQLFDDLSIY